MMAMLKDKEVKAIICLEGGETCNTFIDLLDYEIIKQNPKIITGYSDITVLLQTIYKKTGLVTFHGSSFVCFGEEDAEEKYKEFESAFVNRQIGKFINGNKKIIRSGNVTGKIIGTNLGCMMYLLGTEYLPDMQDKILLIEYTKEYDFPIIKCNDFGHKMVNSIIPIGVNINIDCDNPKIEILDEFLCDI